MYRCFHCQTVVHDGESHAPAQCALISKRKSEMKYLIIGEPDANLIRRILDSAQAVDSMTTGDAAIPATLEPVRPGASPFPPGAGKQQVVARETIAKPSGFQFGAASERELTGVNAGLVRVTRLALTYCSQDFCVYDGIRTYKEQQQHVKDGTSKTMESKHLQGLAVDLVPWFNGKPTWDWNLIWPVAYAMDRAATELGLANRITWGGAWDRKLSDFGGDSLAYKKVVDEYVARHPGKDFIDGPHFEILP
jgi:peptidoglycan L-alanyl-D-glutamate endopeptidase CwlK